MVLSSILTFEERKLLRNRRTGSVRTKCRDLVEAVERRSHAREVKGAFARAAHGLGCADLNRSARGDPSGCRLIGGDRDLRA
jgi:hypothetical protein